MKCIFIFWLRICMLNEMFQLFNDYFIVDKFIKWCLDQRFRRQFRLKSVFHQFLTLNYKTRKNRFIIYNIYSFNYDQWFSIFRIECIKFQYIIWHQNILSIRAFYTKVYFIKISNSFQIKDAQFSKNVNIIAKSFFHILFLCNRILYDC